MPKVSVERKRQKAAQYGGHGYTKHAEGPMHVLANRRKRHRDKARLRRELERGERGRGGNA